MQSSNLSCDNLHSSRVDLCISLSRSSSFEYQITRSSTPTSHAETVGSSCDVTSPCLLYGPRVFGGCGTVTSRGMGRIRAEALGVLKQHRRLFVVEAWGEISRIRIDGESNS